MILSAFTRRLVLYGCCAVLVLLLSACNNKPGSALSPDTAHSGQELFAVAVDRSGSTTGMRDELLKHLETAELLASRRQAYLQIWAFDHTGECIYGSATYNPKGVAEVVKEELATTTTKARPITRPALLLENILKDPHFQQVSKPCLLLLTDGDAEDANDAKRFQAAINELGKKPGLRFALIGVRPENRKTWEAALNVSLSGRYRITGLNEADDAINFLKE